MKTMQRISALFLALVMLAGLPLSAQAATVLPAGLVQIEEEAFAGDSSLQGLARIPSGVTAVGQNAFQGTGLYALDVAAEVDTFAAQESLMLTYAYFHGGSTAVSGDAFSRYVFAPAGSAAAVWAAGTSAIFVNSASLVAADGFYYQVSAGSATLLCPVDPAAVPASVTVPAQVNSTAVTALSASAFEGCSHVTNITLPHGATAAEGAFAGCPNATVTTLPAPVTGTQLVLSAYSITLNADTPTYQLTAQVNSDQFNVQNVRYDVTNTSIASVSDDGWIAPGKDGVTYVTVTAADGTTARCRVEVAFGEYPVSITNVPTSIDKGETILFTLTIDNGNIPPVDQWCTIEAIYFDENGQPLLSSSGSCTFDGNTTTGTCKLVHYGASSIQLIVRDNNWSVFAPGATPSVTIQLTDPAQTPETQFIYHIDYDVGYPGSCAVAHVEALNPETVTSPVPVSITSPDGLVDVDLGTITSTNPSVRGDILFPETWNYVDENGDTEHYIDIHIGEMVKPYYIYLYGLGTLDAYVCPGSTLSRTQSYYCSFPGQQPLSFAVSDSSIATIDDDGSITGLATGSTTATVTTATGQSISFNIFVVPAADGAEGLPELSLYAPAKTLLWDTGSSDYREIFTFITDNNVPLNDVDVYLTINLYDAEMTLIGSYTTDCYLDNSMPCYSMNLPELLRRTSETVAYMEATLTQGDGYVVGKTPTATARFAYSSDPSNLQCFDFSNYISIPAGGTGSIEISIDNPASLVEPVSFSLISTLMASDLASSETVTLEPGDYSVDLSFTLASYLRSGYGFQLALYANGQKIGTVYVDVANGIGSPVTYMVVSVGESFIFPIALNNQVDAEDLTYYSSNPNAIDIDQSGQITAVAEGDSSVYAEFTDRYGTPHTIQMYVEAIHDTNISDESPTLSMSTTVTSAKYGAKFPITIGVEGAEWEEVANNQFFFKVSLLDERKNELTTDYCDVWLEESTQGFTFTQWPVHPELSRAKYLYLYPHNGNNVYLDYTPCLIEITELPEPDTVFYSMEDSLSDNDFYLGSDVQIDLERTSISGNYPEAAIKFLLADGTELYSDTYAEYSRYHYISFPTTGLNAEQEYTGHLWIDGEDTGATFTFVVKEYEMDVYCDSRMAIGEVSTAIPTFNNNPDYETTLTFASSDPTILTITDAGEMTAISAGAVTVTVTTAAGQKVENTVYVYDAENTVIPSLALGYADDTHSLDWFEPILLLITMDAQPYQLSDGCNLNLQYEFLDSDGEVLASEKDSLWNQALKQSDILNYWISNATWSDAFARNAATLRLTLLEDIGDSPYYTVAEGSQVLTFGLSSPDDYMSPVMQLMMDTDKTYLVGDEFSIKIKCLNPSLLIEPQEVKLYNDYSGSLMGSGSISADSPECTITCTVPESDYDQLPLSVTYGPTAEYFSIRVKPAPTKATTLAELQSAHPYPDSANLSWQYTYQNAVSLDVTFHESTLTEETYDVVRVGSAESWANNAMFVYSGSQLASKTINVDGDTLFLQFTSDSSINHWGFAVTQIVAHMADGSTVTITE